MFKEAKLLFTLSTLACAEAILAEA